MFKKGTWSGLLAQYDKRSDRIHLKMWNLQHLSVFPAERAPYLPWNPTVSLGKDWLWYLFTFNNQDYLCTVDYFSDYFEIDELHKSKTGATVIGKLKKRFSTHVRGYFSSELSLVVAPYWRAPKRAKQLSGYNPALFWVLSVSCWCLAELIFT